MTVISPEPAILPDASHSTVEHHGDFVKKTFNKNKFMGLNTVNLWRNEVSALLRCLGQPGLQQYVASDVIERSIVTRYAGPPGIARDQVDVVLRSLKEAGVHHRDIIPRNFCIRDGTMTLVDFEWATFPGSIMEHMTCPSGLGDGMRKDTDEESAKEMFRIMDMSKRLEELSKHIFADGVYHDGNSISPGYTYQPLPLNYRSIPSHKDEAVYSDARVMFAYLGKEHLEPKSVLDLCCNVGFHAVQFAYKFKDVRVTGVEAEVHTYRLAKRMLEELGTGNIELFHRSAQDYTATSTDHFDLCVFLNAHMWLHKQGLPALNRVMHWLKGHCMYMFFQTAHKESSGMYTIDSLSTLNDVKDHVESFGWEAELIAKTDVHGGLRGMFFCR